MPACVIFFRKRAVPGFVFDRRAVAQSGAAFCRLSRGAGMPADLIFIPQEGRKDAAQIRAAVAAMARERGF